MSLTADTLANLEVGQEITNVINSYRVSGYPIYCANMARAVAFVYGGFGDGYEVARLLSLAPQMLAALRLIASDTQMGCATITEARQMARDAIAKVRS